MKKGIFLLIVILLSIFPSLICAQTKTEETPKAPATKLEALLVEKGKLVIKDSYELGTFSKLGVASFDALVIYEPGGENLRIKGIRVEIKETGRVERSHTSFLDLEEIESTAKAIKYMMELAEKWKGGSREAYSEVTFATRGDFKIGFYQKDSKRSVYLFSGAVYRTTCFADVEDFPAIKSILDKGFSLLNQK